MNDAELAHWLATQAKRAEDREDASRLEAAAARLRELSMAACVTARECLEVADWLGRRSDYYAKIDAEAVAGMSGPADALDLRAAVLKAAAERLTGSAR